MDASDWRDQLLPETRQHALNKIMDTLKTHASFNDEDGFLELKKIAQSFEEKTYAGATSQFDYLQKLDSKVLLIEQSIDWRAQLQPESRKRIVHKIMDTLKGYLPVSGLEGLDYLQEVAQWFEEKIFIVATSQSDYLRKISLKMLTMEANSQGTMAHNIPLNHVAASNRSPNPESIDWRAQLQPESRKRIVHKIMDTLKRCLPVSGLEGLDCLQEVALRFEEKIFTAATSQSDYLRKISLKMLTMETKSQGTMAHNVPLNHVATSNRPPNPGDH